MTRRDERNAIPDLEIPVSVLVLLHHADKISDAPPLDSLTINEAKTSHRLPLSSSTGWLNSMEVAEVSVAPLDEGRGTIALPDEPDDLAVIGESLTDQFDRSPIPLVSGALESWYLNVIDESIRDELVNEIKLPTGPYLIGDAAQ